MKFVISSSKNPEGKLEFWKEGEKIKTLNLTEAMQISLREKLAIEAGRTDVNFYEI